MIASDRWWTRLPAHALLLWLVLSALMWVVGVDRGVADADEAALLMQVRQLDETGSWWAGYPGAAIDPDQMFVGVNGARLREGEVAPFGARPAWVGLAWSAWRVGGVPLVTMLGILGVVTAAWSAGWVTSLIEPRGALLALWLAGLGSPLVFQSLVLQGHGLVTGLVGLTLVAALQARRSPDRSAQMTWLCFAAVTSMAACTIRREVFVVAVALAFAGALEVRLRSTRTVAPFFVPLVGALLGILADRELVTSAGLGERSLPAAAVDGGLVDGRVASFARFLVAGFPGETGAVAYLALAATVVCLFAAGLYVIRGSQRVLVWGAVLASVLLLARAAVDPTPMIPGILPAFPLLAPTLVLAARGVRREPLALLLLATFVGFVVATGLTQYPFGGGFEWGSRYLSVGLVAAVPLSAIALVRTWSAIEGRATRGFALGAVAIIALVPTMMGLLAQRHARLTNAANLEAGYALARSLDTRVMVSTHQEIPRVDVDHFTSGAIWLFAPRNLDALLAQLEESGHDEVVLFTRYPIDAVQTFLRGRGWELRDAETRAENPGTLLLGVLTKVPETSQVDGRDHDL